MLDVPDFMAPMMIRFGSKSRLQLPEAVGWHVMPGRAVMKTDE
jgi:hypothetical protein